MIGPGSAVESYTYDANGNRATATNTLNTASSTPSSTSTTIDAQDRLVTYPASGTNQSFTYTKAGDRATRTDSNGQTSYTYDAFGKLLEVDLPGPRTIKPESITRLGDALERFRFLIRLAAFGSIARLIKTC